MRRSFAVCSVPPHRRSSGAGRRLGRRDPAVPARRSRRRRGGCLRRTRHQPGRGRLQPRGGRPPRWSAGAARSRLHGATAALHQPHRRSRVAPPDHRGAARLPHLAHARGSLPVRLRLRRRQARLVRRRLRHRALPGAFHDPRAEARDLRLPSRSSPTSWAIAGVWEPACTTTPAPSVSATIGFSRSSALPASPTSRSSDSPRPTPTGSRSTSGSTTAPPSWGWGLAWDSGGTIDGSGGMHYAPRDVPDDPVLQQNLQAALDSARASQSFDLPWEARTGIWIGWCLGCASSSTPSTRGGRSSTRLRSPTAPTRSPTAPSAPRPWCGTGGTRRAGGSGSRADLAPTLAVYSGFAVEPSPVPTSDAGARLPARRRHGLRLRRQLSPAERHLRPRLLVPRPSRR